MKSFINRTTYTPVKIFRWDRYRYGDLYGLCYLPDYKIRRKSYAEDARKTDGTDKIIDLSIIGDSFLRDITEGADSILYDARLKSFYYTLTQETINHNFDDNKKNKRILLIERTERYFKIDFLDRDYVNYLNMNQARLINANNSKDNNYRSHKDTDNTSHPDTDVVNYSDSDYVKYLNEDTATNYLKKQAKGILSEMEKRSLLDLRIIPSYINQNIETVLYGFEMFSPLKQIKAELNYKLFDRTNPLVYVSDNKTNLYASQTVDTTNVFSSFKAITDSEIDVVVSNMNYVANAYKRKGFDEVIFCIIPNPVTIIEPNMYRYNELIPRIQRNKNLKVPFIDVYDAFKRYPHPEDLYYRSDTHWSSTGFNIWLDEMNDYLKSYISAPDASKIKNEKAER